MTAATTGTGPVGPAATAETGSAGSPVAGSTSGEVADRLRLAMARLARRLVRAHPDAGMTPSRLTALAALEAAGPLRIGGLAEILGTSAPTTSRLVEGLHERGLVARTPDPDDHRATLVELTEDGATLLHAQRRCTTDDLAHRIDDLAADRRAALVAALPVLEQIALPD
jgi:DNA-binding MarR family transcriptional regulator